MIIWNDQQYSQYVKDELNKEFWAWYSDLFCGIIGIAVVLTPFILFEMFG